MNLVSIGYIWYIFSGKTIKFLNIAGKKEMSDRTLRAFGTA